MFQDICSKMQKCIIQKQNHQGGNILDLEEKVIPVLSFYGLHVS